MSHAVKHVAYTQPQGSQESSPMSDCSGRRLLLLRPQQLHRDCSFQLQSTERPEG